MPKKTTKKETKLGVEEKAPVVKKKPAFHLEIRVNDIEFKTDAKDLETALLEFVASPVFPVGAKTTCFVKYSKGKNERTRLWHTPEARRILKTIGFKGSALAVLAAKLTEDLA